MVKFESVYEDIEILDFNKYRPGYINRQIILLLITLNVKYNLILNFLIKVSDSVFLDLQNEHIKMMENSNCKN